MTLLQAEFVVLKFVATFRLFDVLHEGTGASTVVQMGSLMVSSVRIVRFLFAT